MKAAQTDENVENTQRRVEKMIEKLKEIYAEAKTNIDQDIQKKYYDR